MPRHGGRVPRRRGSPLTLQGKLCSAPGCRSSVSGSLPCHDALVNPWLQTVLAILVGPICTWLVLVVLLSLAGRQVRRPDAVARYLASAPRRRPAASPPEQRPGAAPWRPLPHGCIAGIPRASHRSRARLHTRDRVRG